MPTKISIIENGHTEEIGVLSYGTYITNAPGNTTCVYVKIDTNRLGDGVEIDIPEDYCLLMNVKSGRVRKIQKRTPVSVLSADLNFTILSAAKCVEYINGRLC